MGHHRPAPAASARGLPCRRNHQQTGIAGAAVRDCPAVITIATSGGADTSGSGYGRPDSGSVCNERCTTETTYGSARSISAVPRPSTRILVRCCSPISSRSRKLVLTYRFLLPHPTTTIPETCHSRYALAYTNTTSTSISQSLSKPSQSDEAPEHPSSPTPTVTANPRRTSTRTFGQLAVPVPRTLPQHAVRAHVQNRTGKNERLRGGCP
ncbi:hypothetical protein DL765_002447 [Monosporascus sp. GIB2]|nr:hypothetical protein DL765_002447 [Monosporascus sp. GIB2]